MDNPNYEKKIHKNLIINQYSKSYKLYLLDTNITLSSEDQQNILKCIGKKWKIKDNRRSIFVKFKNKYKNNKFPYTITGAQIKGVAFDSDKNLEPYRGIGVCPQYYYADKNGKLVELKQFENTQQIEGARVGVEAKGAMDFHEAEKESFFSSLLVNNPIKNIKVKIPYAFGEYLNMEYDNDSLGFEVMLFSYSHKQRTKDYYKCLEPNRDKKSAINIFKKILSKRARTLKSLHINGFLVPFLTLDNLQVPFRDDFTILHDIGDSRFLNKVINKLSENQFKAERFWNLYYILQPNRAILPNAKHYDESMEFIKNNYELFIKTTISAYFDFKTTPPESIYDINEYNRVFSELTTKPVTKISSEILNLL